jgi:hypothetical protein
MKSTKEIANSIRVFDVEEGIGGISFRWICEGQTFRVIASYGGGWNHVSISTKNKRIIPSWDIMCNLKDLCFEKDEVVMQLHPKESEYVNIKSNCLHLWQPKNVEIPTPPKILV